MEKKDTRKCTVVFFSFFSFFSFLFSFFFEVRVGVFCIDIRTLFVQ